ncbi:hypothetical protein [Teredinibacter sp. KSP-S5-2]|uniref:hypothetical protein n=1 Tax=Teredinibacter sp. KSP-S5-2 TaxID=3034506 RepID=UPI00293526A7|nr:hypothetical protein [Teredinibacter sp. KSP-S5-2]WNO11655.1 hypothetical protein P5V12_10775 [Teredinibacter sp. KSP-S5-2]
MRNILFLLIFVPVVVYSKPRASTLEEILECSQSVFYGKVLEGRVEVKPILFDGEELVDQHGTYKIQVIKHIAGKRQKGVVEVSSEYSALMIGGMEYHYPAPGLEYIFITWKDGAKLEFSPYHIPRVEKQQGKSYVTGGQHAFLTKVRYLYQDGLELKENSLKSKWDGDDIHEHVNGMLGYKLSSYINKVKAKYGKCSPDE